MTIKELAKRFLAGKQLNTMHDYVVNFDNWRIDGKIRDCRTWYNDGDPIACVYQNDNKELCVYIPDSKYYYIDLTAPIRTDHSYYNRRQAVYFAALELAIADYITFSN